MDAIVLAAGIGARMGLNYPKQFLKIKGKPTFIYSLELLSQVRKIDKIILVCNADSLMEYQKYTDLYHIRDVVFVLGGHTRQESVYNALKYVKTDKVLVHEAARPLVSLDFVNEILSYDKYDVVVPTIPIKFTVIQGSDFMTGELDRSMLHNVQLPQVFKTSILKEVHQKALLDSYQATEDSMMAFHYGFQVKLIPGRESNIKITTPLDVEMVNNLLKNS
jgi:2-C-methyl-D-erythritol 4-phosphate cytidylyltransferase